MALVFVLLLRVGRSQRNQTHNGPLACKLRRRSNRALYPDDPVQKACDMNKIKNTKFNTARVEQGDAVSAGSTHRSTHLFGH